MQNQNKNQQPQTNKQQPYDNHSAQPQNGQHKQGGHGQQVMVQVCDPKLALEQDYSDRRTQFGLSHCVCTGIIFYAFWVQIMMLVINQDGVVAGGFMIAADAVWMISMLIGGVGIFKINQALMLYYQIGMLISLILTIISYIIKFQQKDTNAYKESGTPIVLYIFGLITIIPITIGFIGLGRLVRSLIIELQELSQAPQYQGNHIRLEDEK